MAWLEKQQSFPYEYSPIEGLFFLDGDLLSRKHNTNSVKGQKYPLLMLPSGEQCQLFDIRDPQNPKVHIFGEMDLPLFQSRDDAYIYAAKIAEAVGYVVHKADENAIDALSEEGKYRIIYDAKTNRLSDVVQVFDEEKYTHPAHELMPVSVRAKLPKLYANEDIGLEALAHVKYFTPDSNWTWYASEFDGEDILFGLVSGFEVELGYFTLSELKEVRGPLELPVERDLHFEPKSLRELKAMHDKEHRA